VHRAVKSNAKQVFRKPQVFKKPKPVRFIGFGGILDEQCQLEPKL